MYDIGKKVAEVTLVAHANVTAQHLRKFTSALDKRVTKKTCEIGRACNHIGGLLLRVEVVVNISQSIASNGTFCFYRTTRMISTRD